MRRKVTLHGFFSLSFPPSQVLSSSVGKGYFQLALSQQPGNVQHISQHSQSFSPPKTTPLCEVPSHRQRPPSGDEPLGEDSDEEALDLAQAWVVYRWF